jgi:hydrogenase-4 component B
MGFLGMPRSAGAAEASEAPSGTQAPLALLALTCIGLGLLPTYVIPVLDRAVVPLVHESAVTALVPPFFAAQPEREGLAPGFVSEFHDLGAQVGRDALPGRGLVVLHRGDEHNPVVFAMSTSYMVVMLAVVLATIFAVFTLLTRGRAVARRPVWAGGLRRLKPEFTYTATGFSNPVRVIFQTILSPAATEDSIEAVAQHFRTAIRREDSEVHIVDRFFLEPPVRALGSLAAIVRRMHVGHVNAYAAYVLIAMLVVLLIGTAMR